MQVLKLLLKIGGFGVLAVICLIGSFVGYEAYQRDKREKLYQQVNIEYFVGEASECTDEYPYVFQITNNSRQVVNSVDFTVEIRKKGYSNAINGYTNFTDYKILQPGEKVSSCFFTTISDYSGEKITDRDVTFHTVFKFVDFAEN